ncbi:neuropathy target esterase sws-like isoform X3 [Varroa destructor]|uniref:Neuropathy target esterase sws n=1 Tax=Varroa destructor TaxID=109461 RepID=A0A7M7JEW2_VARDE|nr:neuropathy target esterase sws-like isoform X3 [Varroa destructor]
MAGVGDNSTTPSIHNNCASERETTAVRWLGSWSGVWPRAMMLPSWLKPNVSTLWGPYVPHTWTYWLEANSMTFLQIFLVVVALVLIIVYLHNKFGVKELKADVEKIMGLNKGPRFRKRDKMLFYTKRMLRHVNTLAAQSVNTTSTGGKGRVKKRQMVLRLAKKIMFPRRDIPQLTVKEPSQAFLEEDLTEHREDAKLPPDVLYLIRSIRIFGFLEKPLFVDLYKHIESYNIMQGEMLFDIGDSDDSIYTVYSGCISVYIKEGGDDLMFKEARAGDSIASFLSGLVVLTNKESTFKSVAARATEDSKVLRLRYKEFSDLLKKHPDSMVRLVQVVMIRLQRVNFVALHEYLGLTTQMMKNRPERSKSFINPAKSSPAKVPVSRKTPGLLPQSLPHTPIHGPPPGSLPAAPAVPADGWPTEVPEENVTTPAPPTVESEPVSVMRKTSNIVHRIATGRRASVVGNVNENTMRAPEPSEEECLAQATRAFARILNLSTEDQLKDKLTIRDYKPGENITKQNDLEHINHLYYIIWGTVEVRQKASHKSSDPDEMYFAHAGDTVGIFETLTSEIPFVTRVARTRVRVASAPSSTIYSLLVNNPDAVLHLAANLIEKLSSFVRQIDFAMDWIQVDSGRTVYRQNDTSDAMYIVLSGRLRSVTTAADGKRHLVGEYGRGDLVGLVEVLTEAPRTSTMMAVRDSELAKLPVGLLNVIKIKHPVVVTRLIQLLGQRILGSMRRESVSPTQDVVPIRKSQSNFSTIALLPVTDDVPLHAFAMELNYSIQGLSLRLTSDYVKKELGPNALDKSNEYRLCSWLGQLEDRHKVLLYQCDRDFTSWTQRCIRQADCILIVALAESGPQVGQLEQQAETIAKRTQKELVLLHREGGPSPSNTVEWLNIRSWCSSHHHLRCPKRIFSKRSKLLDVYRKLEGVPCNTHSDFARLARFLTGTSIGLVLGGGGARGCSHVGMIKAITEAGIPIDMVGGVSIGAFMGALWAQEMDMTPFTQKARDWAYRTVSPWQQIFDITYPITAWFTGYAFNSGIHATFGDKQIEDLWLPYFTVTTDITSSYPRVHKHGSLWRYVRASMSLAGILPPLCDPIDGHLLLDGGYVNNLPADEMYRQMGAETIIAVDVGSQDETDLTNYGDTLSGWWLLWKRTVPNFGEPVKIPNSAEIQSRLAYVSCVRQLEEVKTSDYCMYVRPPIDKYKTLQFGLFNEIMEVGYQHGRTLFAGMKAVQHDRKMKFFVTGGVSSEDIPKQAPLKPTTFTDLASIVCRVKKPVKETFEEDDLHSDNFVDDTDFSQEEI